MSWRLFDRAAAGYERWYSEGRGQKADAAERRLLLDLLQPFVNARKVLEIGCGSGHFAGFLAGCGFNVTGLDRAPGMLAEAARRFPGLPLVLGDAHDLPFRDASTDLAIFITTLEFLEDAERALREAVRVACRGVAAMALNRRSLGGLSRRWGPQARGALLSKARDFSIRELRDHLAGAAGPRAGAMVGASTLFPDGLSATVSRIALGDVIGAAVQLKAPNNESGGKR